MSVDLGTLAAATAVKAIVGDTVAEQAWCSSIVCSYDLANVTPAAGVGPVLMLVAHSDYSAAEVEEYIESGNSWSQADKISQEIAKRKIRRIGYIGGMTTQAGQFRDGALVKTKCGWIISSGQTLAFYFYNTGTSAFATSDPDVEVDGHANLWPM